MNGDSDVMDKKIEIINSDLTFSSIVNQDYYPKDLIEDLSNANALIIPNLYNRGEEKVYTFPETTSELFDYIKDNSDDAVIVDIVSDENNYNKLELHSSVIEIASMLVDKALLPIVLSIIANFVYEKIKAYHKKNDEVSAEFQITVTDRDKSKTISYKGPASDIKESIMMATEKIFENDED